MTADGGRPTGVARLARRADGNSGKPVAQQLGVANEPGLASQYEEDGLNCVLGQVRIAHLVATDARDHGPMPSHQRGEGSLGGCVAT